MKKLNKFLVYDIDTGDEFIITLEASTIKEAQNKVNATFIRILEMINEK